MPEECPIIQQLIEELEKDQITWPVIPPIINLIIPGFWQFSTGRILRAFIWASAILITAPLVIPAIVLWALCLADAFRLDAADHAATPPPLP